MKNMARSIQRLQCAIYGKIAYSYRESTYNNPFNHLIICAYEYLKKKFPDQTEAMINDCTAYDAIRQIRTFISYNNYQNSIMIAKNLRPITHPFFLEYEALRQTCIMILRDEGVSIFSGNENETQSIVFYLPDLWELYMEKHLKKDKMDYKINSQCKLKVLSMQEIPNDKISQIEFKCDDNGDFRLKTYPDFVFFDGDTPFMILDAKFKLETWVSNGNITNANLDDYTKCLRDMVDFNSHATGVIYPTKNKDEKASVHYISEHNRTDHFYLFPVIIPDVKEELSYFDWHEQLTKYINSSAKSINDYAEKEKERIKSYRFKIT